MYNISAVYPAGQTANTPKSPCFKGVYNANYALTLKVPRREFIYYRAFLATSTREANAAASWIAISESIFLFSVIPAFFRPFMNVE